MTVKVQFSTVALLKAFVIPPPPKLPVVLAVNTQLMTVGLPEPLPIPPPRSWAKFESKVQAVTVGLLSKLTMPPP